MAEYNIQNYVPIGLYSPETKNHGFIRMNIVSVITHTKEASVVYVIKNTVNDFWQNGNIFTVKRLL